MENPDPGGNVTSPRPALGDAISTLALLGIVIWQVWAITAGRQERLVLAVTARRPLESRQQIAAEDVSLALVRVFPQLEWFDDPSDVVGQFVAAPPGPRVVIAAGQPIYSANVSARLPLPADEPGVVAAITPVTSSVPPGDLKPEDKVDVWLSAPAGNETPPAATNASPPQPVLAASAVRVLGTAAGTGAQRRLYLWLTGDKAAQTAQELLSGSVIVIRR